MSDKLDIKYKYHFENPNEFRIYQFPTLQYFSLFEYCSGFCVVTGDPVEEKYLIEKMIKMGTPVVKNLEETSHPKARAGNSNIIKVIQNQDDLNHDESSHLS